METTIQIYKPMHEIILKDGGMYYIESKDAPAFAEECKSSRIVQIGNSWVASREIDEIRESDPKTANFMRNFTPDVRRIVQAKRMQYVSNLAKEPLRETIFDWARRAANGENILATNSQIQPYKQF